MVRFIGFLCHSTQNIPRHGGLYYRMCVFWKKVDILGGDVERYEKSQKMSLLLNYYHSIYSMHLYF